MTVDTSQNDIDPMGKILHAITVEQMENPDCPVVADLLNECLQKKDYEMALRIAESSLTPRKSLFYKFKNLFQK